MKPIEKEEQQGLLSINELLILQRAKYPNRPKWVFNIQMVFLTSWLVITHGNLKFILTFPLTLLYKAYTNNRLAFYSVAAFIIYWMAIDLKAGAIAAFNVLIILLCYKSFKQFKRDVEA